MKSLKPSIYGAVLYLISRASFQVAECGIWYAVSDYLVLWDMTIAMKTYGTATVTSMLSYCSEMRCS